MNEILNMSLDSKNAPGGIVVYYADGDEEIIHVNQYVIDLFECDDFDDFMQLVKGSFRYFVHQDDINVAEDSIWGQVGEQDNFDHIFYRIKTKTGRLVQIEDFGKLVTVPDGRPVFHVFVIEMKERGAIDWLTGLPTMMRFRNLARMESMQMRQRGEQPVAVAFDLIGLRSFNSQHGHGEGDKLVRMFADVLRHNFGYEACSRFAEDHFYALAEADGIEQRLQAVFTEFSAVNDGRTLPVRAGMYACLTDEDVADTGFDRARYACDLNGQVWHSQAMWFSDELRAAEELRLYIRENLEHAISEGWVRPHYQAIIRTATGAACGEEALARWVDPVHGEIMPATFIPVLEEAELLYMLDLHMVDCVVQDMKTKAANGVSIVPVSVNISLQDLKKINIAAEIAQRADAAGVKRDLLRVEFSEMAASDAPDTLKAQIRALHDEGIQVWLDNFGSGYSSLQALGEFNFNLVKLDMKFIQSVHNDKAGEIVRSVIQVAGKLGIGTLALGVETQEQDLFLASTGCSMLQGYHYSIANPLDVIIGRTKNGTALARESMDEFFYWNAVSAVDLADPSTSFGGSDVEGNPLTEFPAGVLELRDNVWYVLRANNAFESFMLNSGLASNSIARYKTPVFERTADEDFRRAIEKCIKSGNWERIAGRAEYGTGMQFYVRPIIATSNAQAIAIASVPTMLGTALGTYGDVPVAYAVLQAIPNQAGDALDDAEYIYANAQYCEWTSFNQQNIPGSSFVMLSGRDESKIWLPHIKQAAIDRQNVHDVCYSPNLGHWVSFYVAPSPIEGCCVMALSIADDEREERQEMIMGLDTSDLIIRITEMFNQERDYDTAMNKALAMISRTIHPKHLYILERIGDIVKYSYEWCAEGVEPQLGKLPDLSSSVIEDWGDALGQGSVVMLPDIKAAKGPDELFQNHFAVQDAQSALAITLFSEGSIVGYLSAIDYQFDEGLDATRLLETVATAISARIANRRLVEELGRTGTHDSLTMLLNRRGIDLAIEERMTESADMRFVLALIDIDDFKTLNDLHGHAVGDEALRALARQLNSVFSTDSIVGRNGGDEFLAMLFGNDMARAEALFGKLTQSRLEYYCNGKKYQISLSVGIVEYPTQATSLKEAYTMADTALYSVKLSGKGNFRSYSPDFESRYRSSLAFSARMFAENAPNGVLVLDATDPGQILHANNRFVDMAGCDNFTNFMRTVEGRIENVVHPHDIEGFKSAFPAVEQGSYGDASDSRPCFEFRIVAKTGIAHKVIASSCIVDIEEIGEVYYLSLIALG